MLGCLEIQYGHKQLGMERTTTNSLVSFQPFQPGRNKLRHALIPRTSIKKASYIPVFNTRIYQLFKLSVFPPIARNTSREVMRQGGLMLAAGRARSKKKQTKKTRNSAAPKTHTPRNAFFYFWKLPLDLRAAINTKGDMSDMVIAQPT